MDLKTKHQIQELITSIGIREDELLESVGSSASSVKTSPVDLTSEKLHAVVGVLSRAEHWFDSQADAWEWFVNCELSGFGGRTPAAIIRDYDVQGIDALLLFIESKEIGGFE